MSLLEAMAYGCCCVTSDLAECADVIADVGLTFRRGDCNGLRRAMESLLSDYGETRSLGLTARKRALGAFSWDSVVRWTIETYEGNN